MSDNNTKAQTPENNKTDPLGYDVYARTLWTRIQAALNKDRGPNKLGDDPLVVGIFGEWGAGKSHLLNLLHQQAKANLKTEQKCREQDDGFQLTVPVLFQPWKYEHEEHLHVPLVMHVIEALKDSFKQEHKSALQVASTAVAEAQTTAATTAKWTEKGAKALKTAYPVIQKVVGSLSMLGVSVNLPDLPDDWLDDLAEAAHKTEEKLQKDEDEAKAKKLKHEEKALRYTADGLYFYRIHELLRKLTRPGKDEWVEDELKSDHFTASTHINFVIFIDDLDRCLPEKAVQTLELIKTVFNVESFAFVLALDDEVIERGIGHRYKEYKLQDKKPEMPITGFEYLEKIVHLPFRLPALTRADALIFLRNKEAELRAALPKDSPLLTAPYPEKWFDEIPCQSALTHSDRLRHDYKQARPDAGPETGLRSTIIESIAKLTVDTQTPIAAQLNLALMVVSCFEAYVPRKLLRVVELYYQVLQVADARGRRVLPELGRDGRDPRVVLAMVLLQLFQPELHRTMKRVGRGFDELREAFSEYEISPSSSDFDLLDWACFGYQQASHNPSASKPINAQEAMQRIAQLDDKDRPRAQRVRLPVIEKLLEHRAAQRHVFDPLRLFQSLQDTAANIPLTKGNSRGYYSLLSLSELQPDEWNENLHVLRILTSEAPRTSASSADPRPRHEINDVQGLYLKLISSSGSEQAELASTQGLQVGHVLSQETATALLNRLKTWLDSSPEKPQKVKLRILLRGLQYLAPHIAREDGEAFWNLVKNIKEAQPPTEPNQPTDKPALTSLYMDVQSMLGQDKRFNAERYYLITSDKSGNDAPDFMANFVRFDGGKYTAGNTPNVDAGPPFYMARTHATVDQFRVFEERGGYSTEEYWDDQGWLWVTNNERFTREMPDDKDWREWLERRSGDARKQPWNWDEQKRIGSRAVWGITWFEARAYARWLEAQLEKELDTLPRPANANPQQRYTVCLPTEAQWEFAARADAQGKPHAHRWPWGDGDKQAHLIANINQSNIDHSSVPGCFAPNHAGLWDMAGNLWQWQNGLYSKALPKGEKGNAIVLSLNDDHRRLPKNYMHDLRGDWEQSDRAALRGGSWIDDPLFAACPYRLGSQADGWVGDIGFRVMLSLA